MRSISLRRLSLASALALVVFATVASAAAAATTVTGPNGEWTTGDTRPGGTVSFVGGPASPPLGVGSLQMTSDGPTAKAQFVTNAYVGGSLDSLGDISYWDYRSSASTTTPVQRISLNVPVFLNGAAGGFTTLVFEPVYQPGAAFSSDTWQQWVASGSGVWWSTRTVVGADGTIFCGGATYTCMRTWDDILASFPDAVVSDSLGFNIGSGWAGTFSGNADALTVGGTTYDFEPVLTPISKDACKNGGWQTFNTPTFSNQGDCVSYVATGGKS
jgi:hypothetical protein